MNEQKMVASKIANTAKQKSEKLQKKGTEEEHPARPTKAPALYKAGNVGMNHVQWIKLIGR